MTLFLTSRSRKSREKRRKLVIFSSFLQLRLLQKKLKRRRKGEGDKKSKGKLLFERSNKTISETLKQRSGSKGTVHHTRCRTAAPKSVFLFDNCRSRNCFSPFLRQSDLRSSFTTVHTFTFISPLRHSVVIFCYPQTVLRCCKTIRNKEKGRRYIVSVPEGYCQ